MYEGDLWIPPGKTQLPDPGFLAFGELNTGINDLQVTASLNVPVANPANIGIAKIGFRNADPGVIVHPAGWTILTSRTGMAGGAGWADYWYYRLNLPLGYQNTQVSWANNNSAVLQVGVYSTGGRGIASTTAGNNDWNNLNPAVWTGPVSNPDPNAWHIRVYCFQISGANNIAPPLTTTRGVFTVQTIGIARWSEEIAKGPWTANYNVANPGTPQYLMISGAIVLT